MSKFGLRSWSGVFDWLVTGNLQWVLYYMEKDFEGFLEKENLEIFPDNPKRFKDTSNEFLFLHEEFLIGEEYEKIKGKYKKRIEKFIYETTRNTCFLRAVTSNAEIDYIKSNADYIDKIIKKNNSNNEIVFLIKDGVEIRDLPFRFFK